VAYLHLPGISTYSAAKAGAAGFTECLRRELADTPLSTLHVVTGGIDTDMLDTAKGDLDATYARAQSWDDHTPEQWAEKIVGAIEADDEILDPRGKAALGRLASHLPPFVLDKLSERAFNRVGDA
jgi:short-subunit dehydrogenase